MKLCILALCLGVVAAYPVDEYTTADEVGIALGHIRNFLNTDEGLQVAKDYVRALDVKHPIIFMVKAYLEGASDVTLRELLNDLLIGIEHVKPNHNVDHHALFHELGVYFRTEESLAVIKAYFQSINPETVVIAKLKEIVLATDDENLRLVVESILPDAYYYAAEGNEKERLRSLFSQIRAILITAEGIQVVRDYARALEPTHPALFLVKAFIESADDEVLLEILDEFFKNFDQTSYSDYVSKKLESLFLEVKQILDTPAGFAAMRNYLENIRSEHPIVGRLHQFISQATDETLKELLDALFGFAF